MTTIERHEAAHNGARYRQRWDWDQVFWASHCIDCYPGNCPMRVYLKDGKIVREEQAAVFNTVQQGVPDMNPMGCQKGAGWSQMLDSEERLRYPLKRDGERGSGRWKRITWSEAADEIADAIIDAVEEIGPESVVAPSGCNLGTWGAIGRARYMSAIGGLTTDLNAEMNDFSPGHYLTWGTFDPVSSIDDWFHSELVFIWFQNPFYTRIPHIHYALEARYNGAEVFTVAPDVSPSSVHSDYHVPVRPGSDAAFALAMAKVVIDEGLVNETFVREQTDLPLLMNPATKRYLRESEVVAGGSENQFYAWDTVSSSPVPAPRGTLQWGDAVPSLEGVWSVETLNGPVEVTTVFAIMRERLSAYSPESASSACGVHPDTIRTIARKIATKRTNILCCLNNAGKYYHGDLIERSQILLLALTGNWGRQGTGLRAWLSGLFDGWFTVVAKSRRGPEEVVNILDMVDRGVEFAKTIDPTMSRAIMAIEGAKMSGSAAGTGTGFVPPVFWWYHHAGYRDAWQNRRWHDPTMVRDFDDYFQEAVDKGWWSGVDLPRANQPSRVLIECGGNVLRRTRGGGNMLLKNLWPQLKMVVTLDVRMSSTAMHSDIVLPIAHQYEKIGFGIPSTHTMNLTFSDKAVDPPGEALDEWEAFRRLAERLQARAIERGIATYKDAKGGEHDLATAHSTYTTNGQWVDTEIMADEMVRDSAVIGSLPPNASLEEVRREGYFRFQGLGIAARAIAQCTDVEPDQTFVPFRNHVEKGEPYPTLSRRAQFLIEHEWFIEADEHLPRHKEPPAAGGDYPFQMTSGHNRWSIHSLNIANRMMQETHRGTPHLVVNNHDAERLGVSDNDTVRVHNDFGEFIVPVKISATASPGQVIIYNGWELYQFANWGSPNDVEPGMIKWLHLAGGYGHLRYWPTEWQPCAVMRGTRVGLARVD
ncbi:MAG TPA: molybdopterin-dependent oxidoreductase [Tepidiformaceae bacterium]